MCADGGNEERDRCQQRCGDEHRDIIDISVCHRGTKGEDKRLLVFVGSLGTYLVPICCCSIFLLCDITPTHDLEVKIYFKSLN